jgi:hypothetical protein
MEVGDQRHTPAVLPPGKTRYLMYRRLGGPHGQSGRMRKISHLPGFDPRTFQPVASRYTDWAIPAHHNGKEWNELAKVGGGVNINEYCFIIISVTHFRISASLKHYSPIGRRNYGRPLKRLLDTWDRNGSTSGPTPWQIYDDDVSLKSSVT